MRFADKTGEKYSDFDKSALELDMAFVACLILQKCVY